MRYEPVIGLEIHAELNTATKMFCASLNDPNERHPNINICPICMGHPGTLPVINCEAVKKVIMVGLALNGSIPEFSQFDRKNYFYPDLPKGYQISQYKHPLVEGGHLEIKFPMSNVQFPNKSRAAHVTDAHGVKRIRITRIHLEEDTGRLIHDRESNATLIDFNRAGVPLMELVTEPDFRSGAQVRAFGEELQRIFRYIGASDADMEKGQMRVEVNISLRPEGMEQFGTKVEIKNINSFKFAADAVDYEIKRQTEVLEAGERVIQETRGWDDHKGISFSQRKKEDAHDYRYFPEPDLTPLALDRGFVEALRAQVPELPAAKRERFAREYGLDAGMVDVLARDKAMAGYFEEVASELELANKETPEKPLRDLTKTAAALLTGELQRLLKDVSASVRDIRVTPENIAELVLYVAEEKISNVAAKEVLENMFESGEDPSDIIEKKGLWQMSNMKDLEDLTTHIIKENSKAAQDFRDGKEASAQFLVGRVMRETRGRANPKVVQEILKKLLQ